MKTMIAIASLISSCLITSIAEAESITYLIDKLNSPDMNERTSAETALLNQGELAIHELGGIVIDETVDEAHRLRCIKIMGNVGSEEAIEYLEVILEEPNLVLRIGALRAIGKIKSEKAVDILVDELLYKDYELPLKNELVLMLAEMDSPIALGALEEHLSSLRHDIEVLDDPGLLDQLYESIRITEEAKAKIRGK